MYTDYWNLRESPFQNVADTRFAYLSKQHSEALARLIFLVNGFKLGGVLIGAYGAGKTMVLELLSQHIHKHCSSRYFYLNTLPGETLGLAGYILRLVGSEQPITDMTNTIAALRKICNDPTKSFQHTVLAIDEAQLIRDNNTYELLHLLLNLTIPGNDKMSLHPAFTLILSGHMELMEHLNYNKSLCQRIQMVWELEPLNETQTMEYVQYRIRSAGGDIWIFEEDTMPELFRASRGLPRLINNICDIALMLGYAAKVQKVNKNILMAAVTDVNASRMLGTNP